MSTLVQEVTSEIDRRIKDKEALPTHILLSDQGVERAKSEGWSGDANDLICGLFPVYQPNQELVYFLSGFIYPV